MLKTHPSIYYCYDLFRTVCGTWNIETFIALGLQDLEHSENTINNTVVYEQKLIGITTYKYIHFVHNISEICNTSICYKDT